ncbi:unnamed protein product [Taenia asiatica]|uniref:ABC transporter domain-containing protein n=1 Tax=Taenia asiatica TaxID=60517 RepID=A0A0R3WEN6_TAEAS|nr:unnamed protein product [Taenia asiatica]
MDFLALQLMGGTPRSVDGPLSVHFIDPVSAYSFSITAYFPEGQSTSIVGRVGCGKSSLLNALLGNMELVSGRINIKGRLALVSQQAWIFNATLRDNILFHRPYDPERYAKIIKACALEQDIKLLPKGDLTDIGDKGVNLSGGQKQRVSLARACYADADVYLLDDPLAAVDTHVASHLLKHVLGRSGLLAGRTRIIATHHPSAIAASDRVAVLDSGRLVEYGSYASLRRRSTSHLNAFLRSEELRQRLMSESEAASESRSPSAAAMGPETSVVKFTVFWMYIRSMGLCLFLGGVLFLLFTQVAWLGNNIWLADWSNDASNFSVRLRLGVYAVIGMFQVVKTYHCLTTIDNVPLHYPLWKNLFVTTSRQLKRLDSVSKSPIFSHFAETLLGVDTIRAYGLCDLFVNSSDTRVDANNRALFGTLITNRWLSMVLETVGNLMTLSVSVAFVATRDALAAGFAGLVISYTLNVTQGLSWFVRMATEFETNVVSVERIREYSKLTIEVPAKQPPAQWPQGEIEFVNYSTRYRDDLDLVLRSLSFTIMPGEKIGIVGRTGSGKSSLVLALFRIIEAAEGEIRLDGHNIAEIGLHDLRGRITLIPQDPVLFSGTLRFNLDPFNTHSDDTIWAALALANLRSFVEQVSPDGLKMTIAEGGNNLSVGQRQLVCLARALLRQSRVLVLDEATAAVDPQTDQLIQHTVRNEFTSSTVLTIAHRLDTIIDYDRIMVLDAGRLIEMGTPKELAGRSGSLFRGMLLEANLLITVLGSSQI